jgi:hypothetical protein
MELHLWRQQRRAGAEITTAQVYPSVATGIEELSLPASRIKNRTDQFSRATIDGIPKNPGGDSSPYSSFGGCRDAIKAILIDALKVKLHVIDASDGM